MNILTYTEIPTKVRLKKLFFLLLVMISSCESKENGIYNFYIVNESGYPVTLDYYFQSEDCNTCPDSVSILNNDIYLFASMEFDFSGTRFANLSFYDSIRVRFDTLKSFTFYQDGNAINNKSIYNFDTYEIEHLTGVNKHSDHRDYIFPITQLDFIEADTL